MIAGAGFTGGNISLKVTDTTPTFTDILADAVSSSYASISSLSEAFVDLAFVGMALIETFEDWVTIWTRFWTYIKRFTQPGRRSRRRQTTTTVLSKTRKPSEYG